ncbi:Hsp70 family protein [Nocardia sp. CDC159]|uniref:Hsp70 family protein n=1 Tax=Nocardia pulmonis TaxID=2951408 RepID=A0A9X2E8I2_9NOCA|nr:MULTISPECIES: Hsp70 family protein [Nocardia]MCM6775550.1 Hsp70 family protein [Nocardia pulmonis]MCM6787716.1 Hsp70 family protein [Nocardia sp. CDC159]
MLDRTAIIGMGISVGAATTASASITAGGRISVSSRRLTSPDAAVVRELLASIPSQVHVTVADRGEQWVEPIDRVHSLPEPLAALEWLRHEHGPLPPGLVLVYDLGATSLDVAVVRVDADESAIEGTPVRSLDFGGLPLGAVIAETGCSPSDYDSLRAAHIRESFAVIRDALRAAAADLAEIDRILLVGGASRAPEVTRTIAELGRPAVTPADPAHCVAIGAALHAARFATPPAGPGVRTLALAGAAALAVAGVTVASLFLPTHTPAPAPPRPIAAPEAIAPIAWHLHTDDIALKAAAQQGVPTPETAPVREDTATAPPPPPESTPPPRQHTEHRRHHAPRFPWRHHHHHHHHH